MHKKPGPTGPNETWQAGDHYHSLTSGCIDLTQDQADDLNMQIATLKAKTVAAELSRQQYDPTRPCPKCRCTFPADLLYKGESADCSVEHGASEHFDRMCRRCGFEWAETIA